MRKFLAVAFLGAILAFTAGQAFASDRVDYQPPYQSAQTMSTETQDGSSQSTVAGGGAPTSDEPVSPYSQQRYDNYGR